MKASTDARLARLEATACRSGASLRVLLDPGGLDDAAFAVWKAAARAALPEGERVIVVRFVSAEVGGATRH